MARILHQKGANGLVAEYECAVVLVDILTRDGYQVDADPEQLLGARDEAIARVANELSSEQITRARTQGHALAQHISEGIQSKPVQLGLADCSPLELRSAAISVELVGSQTNSGTSADLKVDFVWPQRQLGVPISLKAYGRRPASLGSKGMKASLTRAFLGEAKISDQRFSDFFGDPALQYLELLQDFKAAAHEFYASPEGSAFVRAYQTRKGLPTTAKVNNPLRRKEVGDYFARSRGFVSEHRFASLYSLMWSSGMSHIEEEGEGAWARFLEGFRFLVGMDDDILTLNAVADDTSGAILRVENSYLSDTYADIRRALAPGCLVSLEGRPNSSILAVTLSFEDLTVNALSLAVWKDSTIQFKLNSESTR